MKKKKTFYVYITPKSYNSLLLIAAGNEENDD